MLKTETSRHADAFDPVFEEAYWREHYHTRPYAEDGMPFDEFAPAYRYGADAYARYAGERYDDIETALSEGWDEARGPSSLTWQHAKQAVRDAWKRLSDAIERAMPGDSDRDSK